MVKMAWDREDWEFIAVEATVLELFPCSRQNTISWAQVTFLSVNPTICIQKESIIYPLFPLHPDFHQKIYPVLDCSKVNSLCKYAFTIISLISRQSLGMDFPQQKICSELPISNVKSYHLSFIILLHTKFLSAFLRASWAP